MAGQFRMVTHASANLLVLVSLVAFLGLAVGPRLLGYRTQSMITGSMAPYIHPGDVIVIRPVPAVRLAVGDVISYQVPLQDRRIVTHRVVEVNRTATGVTFRTKGDANQSVDPWTAQVAGTQAWTVRGVVPVAGSVIRWLRELYVSRLLRIVVPAFLALSALQLIWGQSAAPRSPDGPRRPARPLSGPLPAGVRNPYAWSVYPRPGRRWGGPR